MLYLDRRIGESLKIGDDVTVKFLGVDDFGEAIFGIEAPLEITVYRKEIHNKRKSRTHRKRNMGFVKFDRYINESFRIGDDIKIKIIGIDSDEIEMGVELPSDVSIKR